MALSAKKVPNGNRVTEPKDFGALVRKLRKQKGLTQSQAAGLCNVGTRFLSDFENGKPTVELGKVVQVLKGFGLQVTITSRSIPGKTS